MTWIRLARDQSPLSNISKIKGSKLFKLEHVRAKIHNILGSPVFTIMKTSLLSFLFYISSLSRINATPQHNRIARRVQAFVSEYASSSITTPTSSTQTNSLSTIASVSASATTVVALSSSTTQSSASAWSTSIASGSSATQSSASAGSTAPIASSTAQDIETLR
jgi:hypothetical protein